VVPRDQVGGDAPQPGAELMAAVEPRPLPERGRERLRHQVVGEGRPEAPLDVGVQPRRVPAEHLAERLGVVQRRGDDLGIVVQIALGTAHRVHARVFMECFSGGPRGC
jgi:hypothetical protein